MHIPDGIVNGATSAGFGLVAAGGFGASVRRARRVLEDRHVPLAALTAAFVFAAQMVNFPVIAGMSGHLLGGVLACVFVGPSTGVVVVGIVLVVQSMLFADGGLTAIGLNITNMALIGGLGGYGVFRLLRSVLRRAPVAALAAVAAFVSVPLSALGFVAQFAMGGVAEVSLGAVTAAMLGTHILIGIGEGVITGFVVAAVAASRPDLVLGEPARVRA
ncbi:MAG: energy-coupling factor ABC transporter permease [Acidimicrobiia bacterium]|nr:MAG: energy-coupling factor ABC transporter permease [Acidimicrobiia bacterium]